MLNRRTFTKVVGAGVAAASLASVSSGVTAAATGGGSGSAPFRGLGPVKHVHTDLLDIAYYDLGPADGEAVLLGHGWPYSPFAFAEVAPELARRGYRVLIPYLRGHGPTKFLAPDTLRSGQQAALGSDFIAFLDALDVPRALFAGYDWGGRGLSVAAALWPERCAGLVAVNSYLIQNLGRTLVPDAPATEAAHWYYYYFLTEHGKNGLIQNTKELARVVWTKNSPEWKFTEADLDRAAALFDNPDYVDVVLHCYRVRLLAVAGDPRYDELEARLLKQPPITVPAVTLDGLSDGSIPPTDGAPSASHFTGRRIHHQVPGAGHNLPQERPKAFVRAILEVDGLR